MIEKYMYSDGKIIAQNNDKMYIEDYQDNIGDIFSVKNIIEKLEDKKRFINADINIEKSYIEFYKSNKKMANIMGVTFFVFILSVLLISNCGILPSLCLSAFGPCYSLLFSLFSNYRIKNSNKRINGDSLKLETVNEQLENAKKQLTELEKEKTRELESSIPVHEPINVEYRDKLIELTKLANLYYKIGFYEAKLAKFYDKGSLEQKLEEEDFKKEDFQLVKKYFDDKKKTTI